MTYLSLYRRRRPLRFAEMVGQEHVARTLSHALSRGQLAHAYLFCGPRGTGKTSAAKILARAVNCDNFPAPEPCGECHSCRQLLSGASLDVIEMDAASNRGIEEIRELRERTRYASGEGRYKVYIIDEVHMLTTEAFNAFLKTLEEPPPGVIFILATTDPSRLPATIVSRCQRFDFHLLSVHDIYQRLRQLIEQEGWQAEDEAVGLIARLAEGSMRDALGLLEQCQAYSDLLITAEQVRAITGATRVETLDQIIGSLASNDIAGTLQALQEVINGGGDAVLFFKDLTFIFSRLLLAGSSDRCLLGSEEQFYGFKELLERYRGIFPREALMEIIELLHQAGSELRSAHLPQFVLEVAMIRIHRMLFRAGTNCGINRAAAPGKPVPKDEDIEEIKAVNIDSSLTGAGNRIREKAGSASGETAATRDDNRPDGQDDAALLNKIKHNWSQLLIKVGQVQKSTRFYLGSAVPVKLQGDRLTLAFSREAAVPRERIQEKNHRGVLETVLSDFCRKKMQVHTVLSDRLDELPAAVSPAQPQQSQQLKEEDSETEYLFEEAVKIFPGQVFEAEERRNEGYEWRSWEDDETAPEGSG